MVWSPTFFFTISQVDAQFKKIIIRRSRALREGRMHSGFLKSSLFVLAAAFSFAAPPASQAEDATIELKLAHWLPPSHPVHKAMEEWGADVEKASGGTIKYNIVPAQQLVKAFDHYH